MGTGIYFPLCALPFSIIIILLFYRKGHIRSKETWIYGTLIISNLLGLIIEILCSYASSIYTTEKLFSVLIYKLYLVYLILWVSTMAYYVYSMVRNENNIRKKRITVFIIYYIIISLIITYLPIDVVISDDFSTRYTSGLSVQFTYLISSIAITVIVFILIFNLKKLKAKRYVPVIAFVVIGTGAGVIQLFYPQILLMTYIETLICVIMYFTIENPDMKMLEEIKKSKDLAEQSNTEKAMFLYNTSQEIKMPVKGIEEKCEEMLNTYELDEELKEEIRDIKFAAKRLSTTINGVLDMNNSTKNANIEIKTAKYNTKNLFKELVSISKVNMNEAGKELDFRVNIDDSIPEHLLGDAIRLKQIIITIMNNSIKHTETGFIEFNVSYVIKHDNCRLLITIEDSGIGMEASKLETLFYSTDEEIDEEGLLKANDTKESLSVVKLLTNLIGGTVVVNSELGKGSKFTIVLDQEIAKDEKTTTDIAIESLASNKKILVVDDEEESLKQIVKMLSKYDVNVETALWGQECLERIRKHQQFDLILLDENMPRLNGIKTFEKLKLEENFNTPVIIMVDNSHLEYKDRYLINGFSGILEKPVNKKDIDKVMIRYIKTDE